MARARLAVLFGSQGVATGLLLPFIVPILADRGLGPEAIGLALGLSAVATVIAYPAWGYLADMRRGRTSVLRLSAALAALGGLALAATGGSQIATAAIVALISVGTASWGPISDAIALGELGGDSNDYGRIRRWASAGWVGSTLAGGALYTVVGSEPLPVLFAAASLAVAGTAVGLAASSPSAAVSSPHGTPANDAGGLRAFMGLAGRSPVLGPFLLGLFVIAVGGGAAGSFLPLRILDTGGGPLLIGIASALPAAVEIPFFSLSGSLVRRVGLRGVFAAGISVSVLQLLVIAVAPSAAVITVVRTVDGAAWALRYAATVLVVAASLPERMRAMGQSSMWLVVGGIAPILADPLGGFVYSRLGGPALFLIGALTVAAGAAIAIAALRDSAIRAARVVSAL